MKITLPSLSSLFVASVLSLNHVVAQQPRDVTSAEVAVSGPSSASLATSTPQGDMLLSQAIERLNQHRSVAAKVRQEVNLFGHILLGSGEYFQYGPLDGRQLRLSLRMQLGSKSSSLLQVSDGTYLWIFKEMEKKAELQRVDLGRVASARAGNTVAVPLATSMQQMSLGGLPGLLENLAKNFRFDAVRQAKLHEHAVYLVQGRWDPARVAQIIPEQKEEVLSTGAVNLRKLPEQFPRSVVVLLGTQDLFPYRVEFHRNDFATSANENGQAPSGAMVTMQWFEVQLNGAVNPQEFVYEAGARPFTDVTDDYLKSMDTGQ